MAGGKKGKETPAPDTATSVPVPQKPPTSMRKRGEEDLDSKYIGALTQYTIMCTMYMYGVNQIGNITVLDESFSLCTCMY